MIQLLGALPHVNKMPNSLLTHTLRPCRTWSRIDNATMRSRRATEVAVALHEQAKFLPDLFDLFAECNGGKERVAVITGPPGTGKTATILAFARQATAAGAIHCDAIGSRAESTLKFSIMGQLFLSTELPEEIRQTAAQLLEAAATYQATPEAAAAGARDIPPHVVHNLSVLLLELIERTRRPLLLTVDDAQYADAASLHCLSSLAGRLRRTRVMFVITASDWPQPFSPIFLADLPAEPYRRHIRLATLDKGGVEAMMADRLGNQTAHRLAGDAYRITGGNPVLVRSIIDDLGQQSGSHEEMQVTVGPETIRTLSGILHRSHLSMLKMARWLAILEESVEPPMAGRMAGLDPDSAKRALAALDRTGSFKNGRFRHPKLRAAVLDGLAPGEQAAMHADAARLLWLEGAPSEVIADHLLVAADAVEQWVVPTLNDAAERVLVGGQVNRAIDYLRLAIRLAAEPLQTRTHELLMRAEWRVDPVLAKRRGAEMATLIDSGALTGDHALAWSTRFMWFGDANAAGAVLSRVREARQSLDPTDVVRLNALQAWFSLLFPARARSGRWEAQRENIRPGRTAVSPAQEAFSLLVAAMTGHADESATEVERILHESWLEERTIVLLATAVASLLFGRHPEAAERWCESLQQEATACEAPTWQAVFAALRAVIMLRRSDLFAAERYALSALDLIPADSWGIGIGVPLSVLLRASTVMGKYSEVRRHLRTPVPHAMFDTPVGLHYLQALGRFHYARGDLHGALSNFKSIGDLMAEWHMDFPTLLAWRGDAALTYMRLGQKQQAQQLIDEQLRLLGSSNSREHGISMRVRAACSDSAKRPPLLRQAVQELQDCGDRLELAYALADLGHACYDSGDIDQARRTSRRAHQVAKQCGAAVLADSVFPDMKVATTEIEDVGDKRKHVEMMTGLSRAERRVAALAAEGYSNRQIASKLFVTVSTVEQHLTQVYRKLKVNRRSDLPFDLHRKASNSSPC